MNYSNRREEEIVIKTARPLASGMEILTTRGVGFHVPLHPGVESIVDGDHLVLESRGSMTTGLKFLDKPWLFRKSDEDLDEEHRQMMDDFHAMSQKRLDEGREDWGKREAALPEVLRERLEKFRSNSANFDRDGWAYELIICELALLYSASGGVDSDEVNAFADKYGTSGNQHGTAQLLARIMGGKDPTVTVDDMPAGHAPLMGSRDYSGV